MTGLKGIRSVGIIGGLVMIFLGVFMMAKPGATAVLFDWFIGVIFLVGGISQVFAAVAARKETGHFVGRLIAGIAIAALGIFVVVHESTSIFIMGIIIAIFAFALAFQEFSISFARRKEGLQWGSTFFFGIVNLIFGIFMIYNVFATMMAVIMINGIYLVAGGIMLLISGITVKGKK